MKYVADDESLSQRSFTDDTALPFAVDGRQESILLLETLNMKMGNIKKIGARCNYINSRHVVATVGLPARGKTYISRKLVRYLNWVGISTKLFNLGEYRRLTSPSKTCETSDFYDPRNEEAMEFRTQCAVRALSDIANWFESGGVVAIFDATNSTKERRKIIYDYIVNLLHIKLFFVESICDNEDLINKNIVDVKVACPDYAGMDAQSAIDDFKKRIEQYRSNYQPIDEKEEDHLSYMKIIDAGKKCIINNHEGHIQTRIINFLTSIQITSSVIYLTRPGESENDAQGRLGGNSNLTKSGKVFARNLWKYIKNEQTDEMKVWTSCLKNVLQTVQLMEIPIEQWELLDNINTGSWDNMTQTEIEKKYPEEFKARQASKFTFRYPKGESYEDVVGRLEPVIMELERHKSVLLITHKAVIRCLMAYFLDKGSAELPSLEVPLHVLIKLNPAKYGCRVENIRLNPL